MAIDIDMSFIALFWEEFMTSIGIDIGTTSISAVLVEIKSGKVLKSITVSNKTDMSSNGEEHLQDPEKILDKVRNIIDEMIDFNDVQCIGLAGQMHGIVYVTNEGASAGPLYTWMHGGGNEPYKDTTYAEYLSTLTNHDVSSGYGFVTLFYHKEKGLSRVILGFAVLVTILP